MKKRIAHIAGGLTTGGVEAVIYNYFSKIDRGTMSCIILPMIHPIRR